MSDAASTNQMGRIGRWMSRMGERRAAFDGEVSQTKASTWIAMVSMITGGFIALQTYSLEVSKQVDGSVEKTFDMIHLFNGEDMLLPRKRVMSYVYARRECDARIFSRELTNDDFVQVLEFYDLVHACTEARLCDKATAVRFFEPHASFQWPVLKDTVKELRSQKNTMVASMPEDMFATGMAAFADPDATTPPCNGNF